CHERIDDYDDYVVRWLSEQYLFQTIERFRRIRNLHVVESDPAAARPEPKQLQRPYQRYTDNPWCLPGPDSGSRHFHTSTDRDSHIQSDNHLLALDLNEQLAERRCQYLIFAGVIRDRRPVALYLECFDTPSRRNVAGQ